MMKPSPCMRTSSRDIHSILKCAWPWHECKPGTITSLRRASSMKACSNEDAQNLEARRGRADTLYWSGEYAAALPHYEAVFAATSDPTIAQRLEAVRAELARPTPIGPGESGLILPY